MRAKKPYELKLAEALDRVAAHEGRVRESARLIRRLHTVRHILIEALNHIAETSKDPYSVRLAQAAVKDAGDQP